MRMAADSTHRGVITIENAVAIIAIAGRTRAALPPREGSGRHLRRRRPVARFVTAPPPGRRERHRYVRATPVTAGTSTATETASAVSESPEGLALAKLPRCPSVAGAFACEGGGGLQPGDNAPAARPMQGLSERCVACPAPGGNGRLILGITRIVWRGAAASVAPRRENLA